MGFQVYEITLREPGILCGEWDYPHETIMAYSERLAKQEALKRHPGHEVLFCKMIKDPLSGGRGNV